MEGFWYGVWVLGLAAISTALTISSHHIDGGWGIVAGFWAYVLTVLTGAMMVSALYELRFEMTKK